MSTAFSLFTARVARLPRPLRYAVYAFPIFVGGRAMNFVVQNYIAADEKAALIKTIDESHSRSTLFGIPVRPVHEEVARGSDGEFFVNDEAMVAHWYQQDGDTRRQLTGYAPSR
jgi:hypothetical protein